MNGKKKSFWRDSKGQNTATQMMMFCFDTRRLQRMCIVYTKCVLHIQSQLQIANRALLIDHQDSDVLNLLLQILKKKKKGAFWFKQNLPIIIY